MTAARRYRATLYLLLAPYLIGVAVLVAMPVALSFGLAFTAYDGLSAPTWHGLDNFRDLATTHSSGSPPATRSSSWR